MGICENRRVLMNCKALFIPFALHHFAPVRLCLGGRSETVEVQVHSPGSIEKSGRRPTLHIRPNRSRLAAPAPEKIIVNTSSLLEITNDASFPPTSQFAPPRRMGTMAPPTTDAERVFDWVEFFFKSRMNVKSSQEKGKRKNGYWKRELTNGYWKRENDEQVSRDILKQLNKKLEKALDTKIVVRLISGAAAKVLGFFTRGDWSDLDIWVRGIVAMKEVGILDKDVNEDEDLDEDYKSLKEDPHNMKWRGAEDIQKGKIGEVVHSEDYMTKDEQFCKSRFGYAIGNEDKAGKMIDSCKEIDAWDPVDEPYKLITKELYNYWWMIHSENPQAEALLKLDSYAKVKLPHSNLFDIYIEGYAAQLAFKIGMMSGARQENHNWNLEPLKLNCGLTKEEPIVVKNTDVSDLVHAFIRLVQDPVQRDMWNEWVTHVRTIKYSETHENYQKYLSKLYEKGELQLYWNSLERWLKLYRPSKGSSTKYWFRIKTKQPQPKEVTVEKFPAHWFNEEIHSALEDKKGLEEFQNTINDEELTKVLTYKFSQREDQYLMIIEKFSETKTLTKREVDLMKKSSQMSRENTYSFSEHEVKPNKKSWKRFLKFPFKSCFGMRR